MNKNYQNVLSLIPEFGNKKLLLKYFVAYENRESQQNLFNFWLYVIDTLSKNYYHSSIVNTLGFKSLFTQFQSYPLCLDNILLQMQQQNLIIFVNNQWDDILVDIIQGNDMKQSKNDRGIFKYWKKIISLFYQDVRVKNQDYQEAQNFIIIQQFKENCEIVKTILEEQQIKLFNNASTAQDIQQQTQISEFEINTIFRVLMKSGSIEKLGKLQQDHYIWSSKNQIDQVNYERRKVIFTLKQHDLNLNEEINDKDYKLFHIEQKIRLDPSLIKINEKKLIEAQIKQLENKQVIIKRLISSLEQAISDNQIQKVISEVNVILRKYQINNDQLRSSLSQFQESYNIQEDNNNEFNEFKIINRDDEYENEMIKYYQNQK